MTRNLFIFTVFIILAACGEKVPPVPSEVDAPVLVGTDPEDGAVNVKGNSLDINLTFDQNVRCPDVSAVTVDNDAVIDKVHAYDATVTISVSSLAKGMSYTLTIPEGTIKGYRENQKPVGRITFSFSTLTEQGVPQEKDYELNPVTELTNPDASAEARNVYKFLLEQSGKKTLSGVQSSHSNTNDFVDAVHDLTGRHPALAGYDFIFLHYSPTPDSWSWVQDYNDISAAKEQWDNNGLVSYMWHWNVPSSEEVWRNALENYGEFDGYAFYTSQTSFDIKEALKEGTWQNEFIMKDIEEVAGYLQLLEDAGIPVIWRPLHEAAGNYGLYEGGNDSGAWFWWGDRGAEPCKQLWRLLYDRLVNVYGLDNLIWVWTVDVAREQDPYVDKRNLEWYPGDEYVDIIGADIYAADTGAKNEHYQSLVNLTKGRKLVTVSECGNIPDPGKCMEAGNRWSWFMVWPNADDDGNLIMTPSGDNFKLNTTDHWKSVMSSPYVIDREDMPSLKQ